MKKVSRVVGALSSAGLLGITLTLAGGGSAVATVAPTIVHAPRIPAGHGLRNTWAASNWSGYAKTGSFTGVSGTWTVPTVTQTSSTTYSSAWIGVDGFNNSNLIQTGTEEDWYNGAAHYNAWWEILPAPETALTSGHQVSAGDHMTASIYETSTIVTTTSRNRFRTTSQHVWVINISDTTQGWSFTTSQPYSGTGTSAEWILEAPQVGGRIATLAHYNYTTNPPSNGTGDFDDAGVPMSVPAGVSSPPPSYTSPGLSYASDSGVMIQNNAQVSTPGNTDGNAFNILYGSTAPTTTPTS